MADEELEVYTVPKFVAEVYEKTKEQLRVFATQLANTEEMARLSQQQQEAIKGYHYRLEQNLAEISLDARIQNNELANFSQNRYNGLLRQCSMFEAQVQADMAILSGSTDELKQAVENLAKSQKELYEAAENSHQTLGGQISDTAEEVKREKRVRRKDGDGAAGEGRGGKNPLRKGVGYGPQPSSGGKRRPPSSGKESPARNRQAGGRAEEAQG
jgi:hypothetical protein